MNGSLEKLYKDNPICRSLVDRGLVALDRLEQAHPRTRDREIPVLRDCQTRVIFLSEIPEDRFYTAAGDGGDLDRGEHLSQTIDHGVIRSKKLEDEQRRLEQFRSLIEGKSICDFGTGHGLFLDLCLDVAADVNGVELRRECIRDVHRRLGNAVRVEPEFEAFSTPFDTVFFFHVLEHLDNQLAPLERALKHMKSGGTIVLEVPHAKDFLIETMALEAFQNFGFWSEHLILHTRETLAHYLGEAGFIDIEVTAFQRFGYANHLHWLRHGKPGGHEIFKDIPTTEFDTAYRQFLCQRDWSDTLIAKARKP